MCISLLKKPRFTAEFCICEQVGDHVVAGARLATEADLAIAIGKLGPCSSLAWARLHCRAEIVGLGLRHKVDRREHLDVADIIQAERDALLLQRTPHATAL